MISVLKNRVRLRNPLLWLRGVVIGLTLIIICHVMIQTIRDLEMYSGIDLRAKVVGARLLVRGMNPYYDFRHELHPDHLRMLDAANYSPVLLLFYAPLCELEWRVQRIIYFSIDWIAILLCYVVLARLFPKRASGTALWAGFVLLFIADFGFRFHLERGQYYVELALLTAAASVYLFRRSDSWLQALPLALLVLLRPTYAICIMCVFLLRRVRHAAYAVCLCGLLFAATLPVVGMSDWKNYAASVRANEHETLDAAYAPASRPAPAVSTEVVEGIDFSKAMTGPGYLADRTLVGLARSSVSPGLARLMHRIAPTQHEFERFNTVCLLFTFCFDLAVMYGFWRGRTTGLIPIAFIFLAPLNIECFAPQRYGYCDVTILAPLLLILATILERGKRGGWVLYGVILTAGFVLPWLAFRFDKHVPLVSFLQYVGILVVLNVVCIKKAWGLQRRSRTHVAIDEKVIGGRVVGLDQG
ncbi:MAG: glycosyltransferase 87 family protein [Terracidiphilus sp.]|jgi:hypothetical protein